MFKTDKNLNICFFNHREIITNGFLRYEKRTFIIFKQDSEMLRSNISRLQQCSPLTNRDFAEFYFLLRLESRKVDDTK